MSHVFHDALPGFDARTVLFDGCSECEHRASLGLGALHMFDTDKMAMLIASTVMREHGALGHDPSHCDAQIMDQLLLVRGLLRRHPSFMEVLAS